MNSKDIARKLFPKISADLTALRSEFVNVVRCPLCLESFGIDAIDDNRLSVEHIIPSAVGGTLPTLTCTRCNNTHGSDLDRNLVSAMEAFDALEGQRELPAVFHNEQGHVAANILWRVGSGGTTEIKIVGEASNPAGLDGIRDHIHDGATLSFTLSFGFIPERYWRAVFRVAYLAAFERLGYRYILDHCGGLVRRVLNGTDPAPDVILQAHPVPEPPQQAWVVPIWKEPSSLAVIFRLRTTTTRYLAVLLPMGADWKALIEIAKQHRNLRLRGTQQSSEIDVTFAADPVKVLRETRFPPDRSGAPPAS